MSVLLTTTGTLNPVPIDDLGGRSFPHPTTDYDLLIEFTTIMLRRSADLQAAITAGYITLKDGNNNSITDVSNFAIDDFTNALHDHADAAGGSILDITNIDATAYRTFFSDNLGDIKELAHGLANYVLTSNGLSADPTWQAAPGSSITLDDAYNNDSGERTITVDDGDVSWDLSGTNSFVIDLSGATGSSDGFFIENGDDYFRFNRNNTNVLTIEALIDELSIELSNHATWTLGDDNNFEVILGGTTAGFFRIGDSGDPSEYWKISRADASNFDLDAALRNVDYALSGGFSFGADTNSELKVTTGNLTLATLTSGNVILNSDGYITFEDAYKFGSTYATDLVLSDNSGEWDTFKTNFGEVSILNALNQAAAGIGGEANTASSAGSGTSIYYQKTGVDLEFNAIKSENNRLSVALDGVSHDVELTVNEANIVHDNLSGVGENNHHNRSHSVTSTSDHTATTYRTFYSDVSGDVQELVHGTATYVLKSGGASADPSWGQVAHSELSGVGADDHHSRSHAMTSTSDHTAGNHMVFYSDGSGNVLELVHGTANYVLTSNGPASAPSWQFNAASCLWSRTGTTLSPLTANDDVDVITTTAVAIYGETSAIAGGPKGVHGYASGNSGTTWGVYGESDSGVGRGVGGFATLAAGAGQGGHFESVGLTGRGVVGLATNSGGGSAGRGGHFESDGINGYAVYATVSSATAHSGYFTGGKFEVISAGAVAIGTTSADVTISTATSGSIKLDAATAVEITQGLITTPTDQILTINPGGVGYTRIGDAGTTSHGLGADSLFVSNYLEVDGIAYFDNTVYLLGLANAASKIRFYDNADLAMGDGSDCVFEFNTIQTVDSLVLGLNSASRMFLICEDGDRGFDFAHTLQTNPTLTIHSANQTTDEWLSSAHDQAQGIITSGKGSVAFDDEYLSSAIPISQTGTAGLNVGFIASSIVAALNELEDDTHTRLHTMTSTSDHAAADNWRVFYSNGSAQVVELALGAAGTYLQSNGAAAAPTFVDPNYLEANPADDTKAAGSKYITDQVDDNDGTNPGCVLYRANDTNWERAKADATGTCRGLTGIVLASGTGSKNILMWGIYRDATVYSFAISDISKPLYVSDSTAGALSLTPPSVGADQWAHPVAFVWDVDAVFHVGNASLLKLNTS